MKKSIKIKPYLRDPVQDPDQTYQLLVVTELNIPSNFILDSESTLASRLVVNDNPEEVILGELCIIYSLGAPDEQALFATIVDYSNLNPKPETTNIIVETIETDQDGDEKPDKGKTTHNWPRLDKKNKV